MSYINASLIKFDGIQQEFIASIAPKPNSFENFWQMIIEKKVSLIVMLTDLQENGRKKSDQYWPDRDNERREIGTGISLQHVSSSYQGVFITRKDFIGFLLNVFFILFLNRILNVYHRGQLVRQVTHLQTKKWADLTAPEDTRIMLDMVQDIRSISLTHVNTEPILVHCSAGVGRTGTFIAVYKLVEEFYDEK